MHSKSNIGSAICCDLHGQRLQNVKSNVVIIIKSLYAFLLECPHDRIFESLFPLSLLVWHCPADKHW